VDNSEALSPLTQDEDKQSTKQHRKLNSWEHGTHQKPGKSSKSIVDDRGKKQNLRIKEKIHFLLWY